MLQLNKREGLNCKVGMMRCSPWPMVAGQVRGEVEMKVVEGGEVEIFGGEDIYGGEDILERYFGNLVEGKRRKEKGKRKKKLKREDIFLVSKNENIRNTDSRD